MAWAKMKIMYYLETVAAVGLQVVKLSKIKLIKLNEYQRSRPLFDIGHRSLRFQNQNLYFSETVESFITKFHMKAYG